MNREWRRVEYPSRIVCTTTESVDILYRLGLGNRIVGISGFTVEPPEARQKAKIGTYTSIKLGKIQELQPDLVVSFSDLQAPITHDLVKAGFTVFTMNQRTVRGILEAVLMLGSLVGAADQARNLVEEMQREMEEVRTRAAQLPRRPRVYFEEWNDPLISGIGWVGELIEIAGGEDIFPDVKGSTAPERVISPEEVLRRNPDLIIASWCGKKVNIQSILQRTGWEQIEAVKRSRVHEIKSAYILEPGPMVLKGLEQIHTLIMEEFGACPQP
jgi:iron complex transport system substrate-binding protein